MSDALLTEPVRITLPAETAGKRLDAALAAAFPDLGLRGRRRLWLHCRILLDGRERGPAHRVAGGESVSILPAASPAPGPQTFDIRLIGRTNEYAALFKPAGLPSAALAGDPTPSLESLLPLSWEDFHRQDPGLPATPPRLLTRLDTPTDGLVLAAFGPEATEAFRALEAAGRTRKFYMTWVHGRLEAPLTLTRALDTADRKKTRVLPHDDPDPARHTLVEPIRPVNHPEGPATLVTAVIFRGARHQIRAHLAAAGHPLIGDSLYGGTGAPTDFCLRHYRLELADLTFALEEKND